MTQTIDATLATIEASRSRASVRYYELLWGAPESEAGELQSVLAQLNMPLRLAREHADAISQARHMQGLIDRTAELRRVHDAAQQALLEGMKEILQQRAALNERERKLRMAADGDGGEASATEARRAIQDLCRRYSDLFRNMPANALPFVKSVVCR